MRKLFVDSAHRFSFNLSAFNMHKPNCSMIFQPNATFGLFLFRAVPAMPKQSQPKSQLPNTLSAIWKPKVFFEALCLLAVWPDFPKLREGIFFNQTLSLKDFSFSRSQDDLKLQPKLKPVYHLLLSRFCLSKGFNRFHYSLPVTTCLRFSSFRHLSFF